MTRQLHVQSPARSPGRVRSLLKEKGPEVNLRLRTGRLLAGGVVGAMLVALNVPLTTASAAGPNLALGKAAAASSVNASFVASNVNDGNQSSYWEGASSFPGWVQVDLGSTQSVNSVTMQLPASWGTRTETLSLQGSTDGSTWATIVASATYTFTSGTNSVPISFTSFNTRFVRVNITANSGWTAPQLSELQVYGPTSTSTNLAAGHATSEGGHTQTYVSGNAVDANQSTYWEGPANNWATNWLQVDLGSAVANLNSVVVKLPTAWGARTQTFSVQASTDGTTFNTIVPSAAYSFAPSANTVTINFNSTTQRYIRLAFTANTGSTGGQVSELEVYAAGGDTTAPSVPANLTGTTSGTTVTLTWGASTDNVGVTGYDIYGNGTLVTSVGNVTTAQVTGVPLNATVNYTVKAHDAAGNQSAASNTWTHVGDTAAPTAPANLSGTTSGTTVTLTWTASTDNVGVTGYDLYVNGAFSKTVTGTSTTDTEASSASVNYWVKARDAAGNVSAASNTFTRGCVSGCSDTTPPSAPSNLTGSTSGTTVTLSWGASTDNVGVTAYDVFSDAAGTTPIGTVSGTTTTFTVSNVATTTTVTYTVKARDAAGNSSVASNGWTHQGQTVGCTTPVDQAAGKTATSSSDTFSFVAANAIDGSLTTYWEGAVPSWLNVAMGANRNISSVVVKLNPDPAWGTRTQSFSIEGRDQAAGSSYTTVKASATYTFTSGSNVVTIPVTATAADMRLSFTANSGAPGGQVAELQLVGCPAPNPDLTITSVTSSPASPLENTPITLSATVKNQGTAPSGATDVNFYLGTTKVGTAAVGALTAGTSVTVSSNIGTQNAGTYSVSAKVDESNAVVEQDETNNTGTGGNITVAPIQSADLVPVTSWSPGNPSAGNTVTFTTIVKNQGNQPSSAGTHSVTVTIKDSTGATVKTLTGSNTSTIAAGSSVSVTMGTWVAVNGKYTVTSTVSADPAEDPSKTANNTATVSFFVGRGANMPYDFYEAEAGAVSGGAAVTAPNRTIGDISGEASGRQAVTLNQTGAQVSVTTRASTNTIDVRFSIPDGTNTTLAVFNGSTQVGTINLTSQYAWLYGDQTSPQNTPGAGPRHIYDEANARLNTTVPAGSTLTVRNTTGASIALDFIELEQAAAIANPDPTKYVVPVTLDQNGIQAAISAASQDATKVGVYLPEGDYTVSSKFQVSQKALDIVGAGPWFTRLLAPSGQTNTDIGFAPSGAAATGSKFRNFALFGNYNIRADGAGQPFGLTSVSNITLDNLWVTHTVVMVWGQNVDNSTFTNNRINDTFADGITMANDSQGNLVSNNAAHATGDDSFALFNAQDVHAGINQNNTYQNLTAILTWRAAGIAVYGGASNTFKNIYVADQLTYPGVTISSINFGISFIGFSGTTTFDSITVNRSGGHFWGNEQIFPAFWLYSGDGAFTGIRVSNVDIDDPTYNGIGFQEKYTSGPTPTNPIQDTTLTNVTVTRANTPRADKSNVDATASSYNLSGRDGGAIWCNAMPEPGQGPATGAVTFTNLVMANNSFDIINTCPNFTITRN
ncbi:MAG: hypothetical protein QOI76_3345 [Frankiales bacterium]|nr:hypothetical protein [Frankiales bacterium]